MSFLYPAFLFALAGVAIPIVIHLFNFRKYKKIYFSNIAFLKTIEQQTGGGRKLRNLLVLLARVLAIVFLVLAFARPYLPQKEGIALSGQQLVSIYVDNSHSMEAQSKDGSLLDDAKRYAREIASLYSLNTRFQLLTNDFEGYRQRLLPYEDFLDALDKVKISPASKTLQQLVNRQQETFSGSRGVKTVYLISDFQKNMLGHGPLMPDSTTTVKLIRLKANAQANISIDSVWFASPVHKPGDVEQLMVKLKNHSDEDALHIPLKLVINKQQKAIGNVSLKARQTVTDTLSFSGLSGGWQEGEVQATDYPLVFDDRFYFSFHLRRELPVLAINPQQPNPYLEAVYRADSFFKLQQTPAGNINYSRLSSYPLIILNDVADISDGIATQLQRYVKDGGSLMIFPSLSEDTAPLKKLLAGLGTDIPEQLVSAETRISKINLQHPLFTDVFEDTPRDMDLPVAKKFVRYSQQSRTTKQRILELPGGSSFLSRYGFGNGEVYLAAVPLTEDASNLVHHAVFLPLMYRAAFLSLNDNRLFYTIGKDELLETEKTFLTANQTLKLKKDKFEAIPDLRQTESATQLFIADQVKEEGIYQLYKADSLAGVFAFNTDRSESDLTYASDEQLESLFPGRQTELFNIQKEPVQKVIKTGGRETQLWKLCIILALLCFAAEILLIRFFKTSAYKTSTF